MIEVDLIVQTTSLKQITLKEQLAFRYFNGLNFLLNSWFTCRHWHKDDTLSKCWKTCKVISMLPLVISSSFCKLVCLFSWESSRSVQRKGKLKLRIKHWIKCNFKKKINNRKFFLIHLTNLSNFAYIVHVKRYFWKWSILLRKGIKMLWFC